MGGLGHYLEAEGIATTSISLIRLHTEKSRPPRALWVPFELGRPLGNPDDAETRMAVLRHALGLLERPGPAPVLEDWPAEQKAQEADWQPPDLPWTGVGPADPADPAAWQAALQADIDSLLPRWSARRRASGRTTVGLSGLAPEALAAFMAPFAAAEPRGAVSDLKQQAQRLRYAADDLKAFHLEAADDGAAAPPSSMLANWFWDDTASGAFLLHLRKVLGAAEHPRLKMVGGGMLVPGTQLARR